MISRRHFIVFVPTSVLTAGHSVYAREPKLRITVPGHAVGALAAAVGDKAIDLAIDRSLPATQIRIRSGQLVDVADRVMLKGDHAAKTRFLDDARNATTTAANIRNALMAAAPALADLFRGNHRAWSRPFARQAVRWSQKLSKSAVTNRRLIDTYHRVYLLEWAGAVVVTGQAAASPAALAKLPHEPSAMTAAAYAEYVESLVAAIG